MNKHISRLSKWCIAGCLAVLAGGGVPRASAQGVASRHTVQAGETLYRISKAYGVAVEEIVRANPGLTAENLKKGSTIVIPGIAQSGQTTAAGQPAIRTTHVVKAKETLWGISQAYGITLDELVHEPQGTVIMPKRYRLKQRIITLLCAVGLCWLTAVVLYVFLGIFGKNALPHTWLVFLYAVAASAIVVLVFSAVWKWKWVRIISLTVLIWSVLLCIFLTAFVFGQNIWLIFLIGIPLQILALFFFVWRKGARFKE